MDIEIADLGNLILGCSASVPQYRTFITVVVDGTRLKWGNTRSWLGPGTSIGLSINLEFLRVIVEARHAYWITKMDENAYANVFANVPNQSHERGTAAASVLFVRDPGSKYTDERPGCFSAPYYRPLSDTTSREIMDILKPWLDLQYECPAELQVGAKLLQYVEEEFRKPGRSEHIGEDMRLFLARQECGFRLRQDAV